MEYTAIKKLSLWWNLFFNRISVFIHLYILYRAVQAIKQLNQLKKINVPIKTYPSSQSRFIYTSICMNHLLSLFFHEPWAISCEFTIQNLYMCDWMKCTVAAATTTTTTHSQWNYTRKWFCCDCATACAWARINYPRMYVARKLNKFTGRPIYTYVGI